MTLSVIKKRNNEILIKKLKYFFKMLYFFAQMYYNIQCIDFFTFGGYINAISKYER